MVRVRVGGWVGIGVRIRVVGDEVEDWVRIEVDGWLRDVVRIEGGVGVVGRSGIRGGERVSEEEGGDSEVAWEWREEEGVG